MRIRKTKAELLEELAQSRIYLHELHKENQHLKNLVKAYETPAHVLNTMAMTVQRTASMVENLLQSLPTVERMQKKGGDA